MKSLNKQRVGKNAQIIDGFSGESDTANLMASNLTKILNTHSAASRDLLSACINTLLSTAHLADICVVEDEVIDAISCLKPHKSDAAGISTELLKHALLLSQSVLLLCPPLF